MSTPLDIVVVAEAESDARRAKLLIDRVLTEAIGWLREQPELIDSQRTWRGIDAAAYLDIHKVHELADDCRLPRPRGHFDGKPTAEDFHCAVRALWLLIEHGPPNVVVWVRDTDGNKRNTRHQGWRDACQHAGETFDALIAGFPHECMEAWMLAAWSPSSEEDKARLAKERERLGFLPTEEPERLSHKRNVPKSAKMVQHRLCVDDETLSKVALDELRRRGVGCGLSEFMDEVSLMLVREIQNS